MTATRPGLTRLEVLVLRAAGALTLGLALPALAEVQGTAGRERCRNNLKQLGPAALPYADEHGGGELLTPSDF